jgi:Ca2+-binding RTX toxin-like protein
LSGGGGGDVLNGGAGADDLSGDAGRDVLNGDSGADVLRGGAGADTLDGGHGTDRLEGGSGVNQLTGGSGADVFVFKDGGFSRDTITDLQVFGSAKDTIDLSDFGFLTAYADLDAWQAANVTVTADGDVKMRLAGAQSVVIEDHTDRGEAFVEFVMDTILF